MVTVRAADVPAAALEERPITQGELHFFFLLLLSTAWPAGKSVNARVYREKWDGVEGKGATR